MAGGSDRFSPAIAQAQEAPVVFVSHNRMEEIPEPHRAKLIAELTRDEIKNLKFERFLRRSNRVNWVVAVMMTLNGLIAAGRIVFAHMSSSSWWLSLFTVTVCVLCVRANIISIRRQRKHVAELPTLPPKPWDDYIDWNSINPKLRKRGTHAQPPQ